MHCHDINCYVCAAFRDHSDECVSIQFYALFCFNELSRGLDQRVSGAGYIPEARGSTALSLCPICLKLTAASTL